MFWNKKNKEKKTTAAIVTNFILSNLKDGVATYKAGAITLKIFNVTLDEEGELFNFFNSRIGTSTPESICLFEDLYGMKYNLFSYTFIEEGTILIVKKR